MNNFTNSLNEKIGYAESTANSQNQITRSMSMEYGSVAQDIYVDLCGKLGWNIKQRGKFARQKRLYATNATSEGYSVWFLANNNWTKTKGGSWKNEILDKTIKETWEKEEKKKKSIYMVIKRNGLSLQRNATINMSF